MVDFERAYGSMPLIGYGGGKPRRIVEVCACAICRNSRVTLLKREGAYVCGPCYRKLLMLRTLEKQQAAERDHA